MDLFLLFQAFGGQLDRRDRDPGGFTGAIANLSFSQKALLYSLDDCFDTTPLPVLHSIPAPCLNPAKRPFLLLEFGAKENGSTL